MPIHEEESTPPPSPWGWPSAGREQSPRRPQIWHDCIDKRNIPKGGRREQEEACHKEGTVRASRLHDAPGAGEGVERIRAREPAHLRPVLRAAARHPGVDVAAGAGARRDGRRRQVARQTAPPGVQRGAGTDGRGRRQGQHGRADAHDRADGRQAEGAGVGGRRSPYDARETLVREFPDGRVPCQRTIYSHIDAGDVGVARGETPYHPGRRRRPGRRAHPARVLPKAQVNTRKRKCAQTGASPLTCRSLGKYWSYLQEQRVALMLH